MIIKGAFGDAGRHVLSTDGPEWRWFSTSEQDNEGFFWDVSDYQFLSEEFIDWLPER